MLTVKDVLDQELYAEIEIFQNAQHCTKCGVNVLSRSVHDYQTCECGEGGAMADGGHDYIRQSASKFVEHLNIHAHTPLHEAIQSWLWGTYGIKGDQPLKWVKLVECDTDHLEKILNILPEHAPAYPIINLILTEREDI